MRALVIEDNPKMARGIQTGLEEAGFATDVSNTGFEGEDMAAGRAYLHLGLKTPPQRPGQGDMFEG